MTVMTKNEMENIIDGIHTESLKIDNGIYEFYEDGNMSIGVSYEHLGDNYVGYIFNLFLNGEYINIPNTFTSVYDAIDVLVNEWNHYQTTKN